ncbi:MAG: rod shape-determining protein RodA [Christensenellales bacterium]|jgi:rod shape determining protein RodA
MDRKMLKNFDWVFLGTILVLTLFGAVAIANATANPYDMDSSSLIGRILSSMGLYYVRLHLIWFATGLVLMAFVMLADYQIYGALARWIYGITLAMLVAVLVLGSDTRGTTGWFEIGSFGFQPSELGKITLVLVLARTMSNIQGPITRWRDLLRILIVFAIPTALVLAQPDIGMAIIYVVILAVMLFAAKASWKLLLGTGGLGAVAAALMWFFLFNDARRDRVLSFLGITTDTASATHVAQSQLAIGSGQMTGKGLFREGGMSQLGYLPIKHTDFIFAVIAEAAGFLGCLLVIALYMLFCYRMLQQSLRARDKFGQLIIVGVLAMFLFQIFENIGMTIGLMPVTGLPLPFLSYGGTSMWTNLIACGLVLNVSMRRESAGLALESADILSDTASIG